MKKAAMRLALEALEAAEIDGNCEYGATEIIRKALAEPDHIVDANKMEFLYPHAGDALAPRDTKVLLLSRGGICTVGFWGDWCLGWLPLPKRNKKKEETRV